MRGGTAFGSQGRPPTDPSDFPEDGPDSLATVGERVVAKLIDLAILAVPAVLMVLPFVEQGTEVTVEAPPWLTVAVVALLVVYDTVMVGVWSRTAGKFALGLRVAQIEDGGRPDWWRSAVRVLLPAAILVLPMLGVLVGIVFVRAAFDPLRQGWHDKAAATLVVRTR